MKSAAQAISASTQKFTDIVDILDQVVILSGGNACLIIEVTASNFALLSSPEQDARLYSYAALLNSLTFPIQILIRNKRVDITSYLKLLEEEEKKTQNPLLSQHINLYRDFVQTMVKVNVVLNKTFYIIIPFSSLESGVTGAKQSVGKPDPAFLENATKALLSKAESLHSQLSKLAVASKTLNKEELVRLFYDIYNDDVIEVGSLSVGIKSALVSGVK